MVRRWQPTTASRDGRTLQITIAVLVAGLTFGAVVLVAHAVGGHVHGMPSVVAMVTAVVVAAIYLWRPRRVHRLERPSPGPGSRPR
jgi:hypothetical protein